MLIQDSFGCLHYLIALSLENIGWLITFSLNPVDRDVRKRKQGRTDLGKVRNKLWKEEVGIMRSLKSKNRPKYQKIRNVCLKSHLKLMIIYGVHQWLHLSESDRQLLPEIYLDLDSLTEVPEKKRWIQCAVAPTPVSRKDSVGVFIRTFKMVSKRVHFTPILQRPRGTITSDQPILFRPKMAPRLKLPGTQAKCSEGPFWTQPEYTEGHFGQS